MVLYFCKESQNYFNSFYWGIGTIEYLGSVVILGGGVTFVNFPLCIHLC